VYLTRSPGHAGAGSRPQPGDQRQDFLEHLPRTATSASGRSRSGVADDLGADLDQLLRRLVSDTLRRLRRATSA